MELTVKKVGTNIMSAAQRFLYRRGYDLIDVNVDNNTIACLIEYRDTIVIVHVITSDRSQFGRAEFEDALSAFANKDEDFPTDKSVRFDEIKVDVKAPDKALIRHHSDVCSDARISDLATNEKIKAASATEIRGLIDRLNHELVVRGEDD